VALVGGLKLAMDFNDQTSRAAQTRRDDKPRSNARFETTISSSRR
jgi:hypothetical protein